MATREKILNLTQHSASAEQVSVGVCEPTPADKNKIRELLTFEELPDLNEIKARAEALAELASKYDASAAMIGGAPYLMPHLEGELYFKNITPLYAFSKRESVEKALPDGSVQKSSVFKHVGFVRGQAMRMATDFALQNPI